MKRLCVIVALLLTITSTMYARPTLAKSETEIRSLTPSGRSERQSLVTTYTTFIPPIYSCCLISQSLSLPITADTQQVLEAGEIVTARRQLMNYVLDIKEKYQPSEKEYKEARRLFREAQSEYEGWITDLTLAIQQGTVRDLRKDEQYKQKAARIGRASKAFVGYAQSVTTQSKSIFTFASAVADIGIKIWNGVKERRARERAEFAEAFEKRVKWEPWENIPPSTEKPTPTPNT
jgi:hypothetical protein